MDIGREKFYKGQTVYLLVTESGDVFRRLKGSDGKVNPEDRVIETVVTSIGKKYLTVKYNNIQFYLDDNFRQRTDYVVDYMLYTDRNSAYNDMESKKLFRQIHMAFGTFTNPFTLEQLREVAKILNLED